MTGALVDDAHWTGPTEGCLNEERQPRQRSGGKGMVEVEKYFMPCDALPAHPDGTRTRSKDETKSGRSVGRSVEELKAPSSRWIGHNPRGAKYAGRLRWQTVDRLLLSKQSARTQLMAW
jgi:hypothetical protein